MSGKTKSPWHPGTETPDVDWEYPDEDYVSERVIAEWRWVNPLSREVSGEELRFARYYWGKNPHWSIEGITGNAEILRWFNPKDLE